MDFHINFSLCEPCSITNHQYGLKIKNNGAINKYVCLIITNMIYDQFKVVKLELVVARKH
jgi:hypothetical protein